MTDRAPWGERVRARLPGRLQDVPHDLIAPIALAVVAVLALQVARQGRISLGAVIGALTVSFVSLLVSIGVGAWMGRRVWAVRGDRLARRLLVRYAHPERHDLVLTGRPDFRVTTRRRVWEATVFVASLQVLAFLVLGSFIPTLVVALPAFVFLVGSTFAAVLLVPHWVFARLGLRRVDRARFTVEPVTRVYSDRLRLSRGGLVVIVLGVGGAIIRRAGLDDVQAAVTLASLIVDAIAYTLVATVAAVAFYSREEPLVASTVARHAISLGARDGRGESHEELARGIAEARIRNRPR